jgi:hypothetical protein
MAAERSALEPEARVGAAAQMGRERFDREIAPSEAASWQPMSAPPLRVEANP